MSTLTGNQIPRFQLTVWKGAIKLEKLGMKRRGRPCKQIAAQYFGMSPRASHDEVIARIEKELEMK